MALSCSPARRVTVAFRAEALGRRRHEHIPIPSVRRAAINYAIKNRQRGLLRITERLVERGDVPLEGDLDPGLLVWEQQEWVTLLLKSLPLAERQVLACVVDAFRPQEPRCIRPFSACRPAASSCCPCSPATRRIPMRRPALVRSVLEA